MDFYSGIGAETPEATIIVNNLNLTPTRLPLPPSRLRLPLPPSRLRLPLAPTIIHRNW